MNVDYLILSSLYDFSTDMVVQELERQGKSYVRLNKEHLSNYRMTLDPVANSLEIKMPNSVSFVTKNLKAIYYRQPIFLRNTPGESLSLQEQLSRSQWMGFLRSLQVFDRARWMNPLTSTYLSETKAYQLSAASKIGFKVPQTLIGNDVRAFHTLEAPFIIKSLDTVLLRENEDCLFTYSTIANHSELRDENVSSVPFTTQQYIEPKVDIRVTVIGSFLSAVKITSEGNGIDEDWRLIDREALSYDEIKLPDQLEKKCFKLLEVLGLNFGAIDLIKSNNDFYFIEINPTGEWGWLVNEELRLDKHIVSWLMGEQ